MKSSARHRRLMALAMTAALLPSLLYLGHWSVRVRVPGTDAYVAVGILAEHEAQASEGGHEKHCHGTATCTDSPPAPVGVGFAMLNEMLTLLGAGGTMTLLAVLAWRPARVAGVPPLLMPPRLAVGT
ncbi:MAG: hypothetical protein WD557_01770 [Dehalococcoidia bacterium]